MIEELDVIFTLETGICLMHALGSGHGFNIQLIYSAVAMGFLLEETAIQIGGTHCHTSSPYINIAQCSSLNSVLFYVPWIYCGILTTLKLSSSPKHWAMPLLAGMIFFGFGATYELQAPFRGWWFWPNSLGVAIGNNVIAVPHVVDALSDTLWGTPLMTIYFHSAIGGAIMLLLQFVNFKHPFVVSVFAPIAGLLWNIPVKGLLILFPTLKKSFIIPLIMIFNSYMALLAGPGLSVNPPRDSLLLLVPVVHHGFFIYTALCRDARGYVPPDVKLFLVLVAILSTLMHMRACGYISVHNKPKRPKG
jgi:hypothetical protein